MVEKRDVVIVVTIVLVVSAMYVTSATFSSSYNPAAKGAPANTGSGNVSDAVGNGNAAVGNGKTQLPPPPQSTEGQTDGGKLNALRRFTLKSDALDALTEAHTAACNRQTTKGAQRTNSFAVHSFHGDVGWTRFWIQSLDAKGSPQCVGKDVYHVMMESEDAKVAVDRVIDMGNGLYEVQAEVRRPGTYSLCVYLQFSQPSTDIFFMTEKVIGTFFKADKMEAPPKDEPFCLNRDIANWTKCVKGAFTGPARVPKSSARCTRAHALRGAFRRGGWLRMKNNVCDGVYCTGPLAVIDSDGWVWASDDCVVHIYDTDAMWNVVDNEYVLLWGDSTGKQPLANWIEYDLKVPVFSIFMEDLPGARARTKGNKRAAKQVPGFFSYRFYNTEKHNPKNASQHARFGMVWGGCQNLVAGPTCKEIGLTNRHHIRQYLVKSKEGAPPPSVLLLTHFIWRYPMLDDKEFCNQINDALNYINGAYDAINVTRPLVVFNTGNHRIMNDDSRCFTPTFSTDTHMHWTIEDALAERYASKGASENVVTLSRHQMTMPFHKGDEFVHFGIHYGATKGMCATGLDYKDGYNFKRCLRRTFPDAMLRQLWANIMYKG